MSSELFSMKIIRLKYVSTFLNYYYSIFHAAKYTLLYFFSILDTFFGMKNNDIYFLAKFREYFFNRAPYHPWMKLSFKFC